MHFLVNLDVDDLTKAIAFYTAAFGLQIGRRFGAFGAEMLGGPTAIYLLEKVAGTPATATSASGSHSQQRSYVRHWTPLHLDFVVDEIEVAVRNALAAGAQLEKPITPYNWGKLAVMADPFGHGFCFIEFTGRGYDEIAE